jgi:hypothetical protein
MRQNYGGVEMSYMNVGGVCSTKTWWSWHFMKQRVLNPNNRDYSRYRDRHIDPRWMVYENFHADMGDKPEGLSLDRKDNNKGYSKENCRWATPHQQASNKILNCRGRVLTVEGVRNIKVKLKEKRNRELAEEYGVSISAISSIRSGRAWREVANV